MLKYHLASKWQRILSFLIDASIVFGLGYLVSFLIIKFSGFGDYYNEIFNNNYKYIYESPNSKEALDCINVITQRLGIFFLVYFVFVLIYLVIMPYFIEWQTLGRLVTKTRVLVRIKNERPSILRLLLREVVGEYLIYIVLSFILKFYNVIAYISIGYSLYGNLSIPDLISKTKLVDKKPYEEDDNIDLVMDYDLKEDNTNEDVISEK